MSVPLTFRYPGVWVEVDLADEQGPLVAAQAVLGRYQEPVGRELSADLEQRFAALAELGRKAEVQMAFALVPDPPLVGLAGSLFVRWMPSPDGDPIADLIAQSVPRDADLVEGPQIEHEQTPLGTATVSRLRYSRLSQPQPARGFGRRKFSAPVVEHIRWSWIVDDPSGPPLLVTLTSATDRIRFAPELREHVAEFARGIRVDD
jgi:hypothetical protein